MGISVALSLAALLFGLKKYSNYSKEQDAPATGFGKVLENKWYVDELYESIIT
jgi:NADH-quinone oxidoreductase subunit L